MYKWRGKYIERDGFFPPSPDNLRFFLLWEVLQSLLGFHLQHILFFTLFSFWLLSFFFVCVNAKQHTSEKQQ